MRAGTNRRGKAFSERNYLEQILDKTFVQDFFCIFKPPCRIFSGHFKESPISSSERLNFSFGASRHFVELYCFSFFFDLKSFYYYFFAFGLKKALYFSNRAFGQSGRGPRACEDVRDPL